MYPDLFGIHDFSYIFMIILGVIALSVLLVIYLKHKGLKKESYLDLLIVVMVTIFVGVLFAMLFENVYEAIKHAIYNEPQKFTFAMTFYGGLITGIPTFILMYNLYYLKHNPPVMKDILVIAPACISLGHAFGRIGCFMAGCCYGIEVHSGWGMHFPTHNNQYLLPTQLIEAIFLFGLSAILIFLAFKFDFAYNFVIYCGFYGIFRFIIEFFRGDERGQLAGLSPSQYWCIVLVLITVPLFFYLRNRSLKEGKELKNEI